MSANNKLPVVTASSLPLKAIETDFAVDSSGFSTCHYVCWLNTAISYSFDCSCTTG